MRIKKVLFLYFGMVCALVFLFGCQEEYKIRSRIQSHLVLNTILEHGFAPKMDVGYTTTIFERKDSVSVLEDAVVKVSVLDTDSVFTLSHVGKGTYLQDSLIIQAGYNYVIEVSHRRYPTLTAIVACPSIPEVILRSFDVTHTSTKSTVDVEVDINGDRGENNFYTYSVVPKENPEVPSTTNYDRIFSLLHVDLLEHLQKSYSGTFPRHMKLKKTFAFEQNPPGQKVTTYKQRVVAISQEIVKYLHDLDRSPDGGSIESYNTVNLNSTNIKGGYGVVGAITKYVSPIN